VCVIGRSLLPEPPASTSAFIVLPVFCQHFICACSATPRA
jgi:hypothetical protein